MGDTVYRRSAELCILMFLVNNLQNFANDLKVFGKRLIMGRGSGEIG